MELKHYTDEDLDTLEDYARDRFRMLATDLVTRAFETQGPLSQNFARDAGAEAQMVSASCLALIAAIASAQAAGLAEISGFECAADVVGNGQVALEADLRRKGAEFLDALRKRKGG